MNKLLLTVGFAAGVAAAGAVGMLVSTGKLKPRKLARRTARAMDAMGDAFEDMRHCMRHTRMFR